FFETDRCPHYSCTIHLMLRSSRSKTALVFVLVLLPLVITAVVKYLPSLTSHENISSVAILHPRLIGSNEYTYLENDVAQRLHDALSGVPGLLVRVETTPVGGDLAQLANSVDASAMIVPILTIDAGIVQLNLQVIETRTRKVIFNTPYQSSLEN